MAWGHTGRERQLFSQLGGQVGRERICGFSAQQLLPAWQNHAKNGSLNPIQSMKDILKPAIHILKHFEHM